MAVDPLLQDDEARFLQQIICIERDARERAYLRSLQWTDGQLAAFDRRVSGIHARADRIAKEANE